MKVKSEVFNCDCMELMAKYPDGYFELAIVDPPWGSELVKIQLEKNTRRNLGTTIFQKIDILKNSSELVKIK